jgi:hypothetical protein
MFNLIQHRKQGESIQNMARIIRNNHEGYRDHRWWRSNYQFLDLRNRYRKFGQAMAVCIQDDDSSSALDLISESSVRHRFGWVDFMDAHFSGCYFECHDCDGVFSDDEAHNAYDDYTICGSCVEGYLYSDRRGCYVRDDDEDEQELENIREYHTSSECLGHIPSKYDKRTPRVLLGLELEMEIKDNYCRDERAGFLLESLRQYEHFDYALCENDGSLNNGFEVVTAYTGLDVHAKQLEFFKSGLRGAISHDSDNCGLHVHICKADMSTLHGAKMILFINDQANQKLIKAIARRDGSGFAKFKNKQSDKNWLKSAMSCESKRSQLRNLNSDRYEALNFKNDKTIEFRLFKGSLVYETIMSCLEFTYATWFFTRESSTKNMTIDGFLKFICANENRGDTKFLRAYLKSKGFDLPEKSNVVQFPKSDNLLMKVA